MDIIPFTKAGFEELQKELEHLKRVDRPKIIEQIAEARAHGDLKENMEYHSAREKQQFIEARIRDLDDKLSRGQVIDFSDEKPNIVKFGAWVKVSDEESGEEKKYCIVGDPESKIEDNKISLSSPIARALLGKKVDDLVYVDSPSGGKEYVILEISYH
ncbi:MAG: transcription elongation factor GreA [Proteobacteria bacterium]|nr:transcription elongation factor GreA [Pseudomonadota bacterium]